MKTRKEVEDRLRDIWNRSGSISNRRFAWSLIIVLLGVLLDIREELSDLKRLEMMRQMNFGARVEDDE